MNKKLMISPEKERLLEIIQIATELKWIIPRDDFLSYPTMQLSEVEKCMIAMVDNSYLNEMRDWVEKSRSGARQ